ncbi:MULTISPECIES: hypothetical protein [unclassified Streptomyces]|uniref:hypothetical protein n=1 Tax=unclassified Streptomyces TaxID=2593676 RepID=UPI0004C23D98|nr:MULTISPECIES: hypothetical protein [unclassified Streptomyces]
MSAATTEQTSVEPRPTTPAAADVTAPLRNVARVPWGRIRDSRGSAAAIPPLLNLVAWGDDPVARTALAELRERICQYGFVVEQATAPTVPFLWEIARLPHVTCRAGVVELLRNIAEARQWELTAASYPKLLHQGEDWVGWERQARRAVRADRHLLGPLLTENDPELTTAATALARTLRA